MSKYSPSYLILVVEDEPLIRWHAAEFLADAGFRVIEAEDAASAMCILEERTDIGLVFTDIQMPGQINGLKLAERAHERWPHIGLLITSSGPAKSKDIPMHAQFVPKPYLDQEIIQKIKLMVFNQNNKDPKGTETNIN